MAAISFLIPPEGVTPPDGSTVNIPTVVFEYEIDDITQGVGVIEVSYDNVTFHSVYEGDPPVCCEVLLQRGTFDITFAHGLYTLYFRVIDQLNNIGPVLVWHLNVDISTAITIDPIPAITNDSTLVLTGTMEAGAIVTTKLNGINVPGVTYPTATTWHNILILQEGPNVILATAEDILHNIATATASIILDTVVPGEPIVTEINPAVPDYLNFFEDVVLTNVANQTIVGFKESGTGIWSNGLPVVAINALTTFSFAIVLVEGENTFSLTARDTAGNISAPKVIVIDLDTIGPLNADIVINNDVGFTLTRNVTLTLTADNAIEAKVSEDPTFTNEDYFSFTTSPLSLSFELSRVGGLKTVYAIFRDAANNVTPVVYDSIILPSTVSEVLERTGDMTVEELTVLPLDDYLVRLQDMRDGTFMIELYLTLADAIAQTDRQAHVTTNVPGTQILALIPDVGGITSGTIRATLVTGAELVIYRYRTDVYDPSVDELGQPITYEVEQVQSYAAKVEWPIYEGFALGRILEYAVDGNLKKHRISKAFDLYDSDTAVVRGGYYEVLDTDGAQFPIDGAVFEYPLCPASSKILTLVEEPNAYLITIDHDIDRFDAIFGYEILFSRRRANVTDYYITDAGRVEFWDESGVASGNVRVTYKTPALVESFPDSEFKVIVANLGDVVTLTVYPVDNRILLSDLCSVTVRFFHSAEDSSALAPAYVRAIINDTYIANSANFSIVESNARAEIREFTITNVQLFPNGIPVTLSGENVVLDKVVFEFTVSSENTYVDQIQVIACSTVISSNCRIVVNGEEKYFGSSPVTTTYDNYEIQVQDGIVDFLAGGRYVHTEYLDLDGAQLTLGAGGRVNNDVVRATFKNLTTIEYIDQPSTVLDLVGRCTEIEATVRERGLLEEFTVNFESPASLFPARTYSLDTSVSDFMDTSTVAIIGMGRRDDVLVRQGLGEEDEGAPVDFIQGNDPDGRHFRLTSYPIVPSSLIVTLTHNGAAVTLQPTVDFQLDVTNGYIVLNHPIELNDRLVAQYSSVPDTNAPALFLDAESLYARFGLPSIENTLSLGAKYAFLNGAKRVVAVQALDPTVDPGWAQAYESLTKTEAYFIVPIPPNNYPLVASLGKQHVEEQSSTRRRHERVLLLGETTDLTRDDISSFRDSVRVTFLIPDEMTTVLNGETASLDGRYLAASYAGLLSSFNSPAEPGMGKQLNGFFIDSKQKYTNVQLNQLAEDGICVVRYESQGGKVYRSITTSDSTNAVDQEQSVVRIADYLAINLRNVLDERFIGRPIILPYLAEEMTAATNRFLAMQLATRIITKYIDVVVRVDSEEPRQMNVTFSVQPAFPLVNIFLTVNVVVSV